MMHRTLALMAGMTLVVPSFAQRDEAPAVPPVVVTANRFEMTAAQQPASITVISGDELRRSGEASLLRLLSRQSGVGLLDNSGSPDPQIDLRGFGITGSQNTLILIDGQRLTENELVAPRLSSIPLEAIERIEIVRGAGAVLYGSGATGGVINIITRGSVPGERTAVLAAGGGSYGSRESRASARLAGDNLGLAVHAQHQRTDNYRDNNRFEQNNVIADVSLRRDATSLAFSAGGDNQKLRLPGNRTATELAADRRGTRTPDDYSNIDGGFARLSAAQAVDSHELAVDIAYRHKKNDFNAVIFGVPLRGNTEVERWSLTPRARLAFATPGMSHNVVVGTEFEWWDYRSVRSNPADVSAEQRLSALFVQDSITLTPDTRVLLGGRHQRIDYQASDPVSIGGALDAEQTRSLGAYEIGLRQVLSPSLDAFARYGRSFRVATLDEVYTPSIGAFVFPGSLGFLEPQTSHDAEVGVEYRQERASVRASVFNADIKNEIHFDPNSGTNVNLPPTRRRGFELDARLSLGRQIELSTHYNYTEAQFRSGTLGGASVQDNRIPLVPRHRIGAGIGFEPDEATRIGADATYVGAQRYDGDEANSFPGEMPAYTVVDLSASRRIGQWRLAALVNNLFNEHYYSYALAFAPSSIFTYPAAERSFLVSAEYRFGP